MEDLKDSLEKFGWSSGRGGGGVGGGEASVSLGTVGYMLRDCAETMDDGS